MAKDKLEDWDEVAANNLDMGGISLAENVMRPPAVNNEMREHMAQVSKWLGDDTLVAAATTDLGSVPGRYISITGNTGITSFGTIKAGTIKYLKFTGTPTITYNATSMILPGAASITAAAGDTAVVVSEGSGNWRCIAYSRASGAALVVAVVAPPQGYLFGLTLSNNATDAVNDIDIAVGEAASDTTPYVTMSLTSILTKRLDAAWAVGTGNGGLDTGSIANTTYHMFLIRRPDTGVVDVLFSASPTAPTMPTNYTQKRRIGSVIRASAALVLFNQSGDEFLLSNPFASYSLANPGTAAITVPLMVPTGLITRAYVAAALVEASAAAPALYISAPAVNDNAPAANTYFSLIVSNNRTAGDFFIRTDTSSQLRYRLSLSSATTTVNFITKGWYDTRGR